MFQVTRQGSQMIVDIHGMHAREARFRLDLLIDNAPEEVREIIVIHGYSMGKCLKTWCETISPARGSKPFAPLTTPGKP